jgi:hypothetical protein
MDKIELKFEWEQSEKGFPIYWVNSLVDPELDKPLLRIEYRVIPEGRDPWLIEILGVRIVTRNGSMHDHEQIKQMAESMLGSMARQIEDKYYEDVDNKD